MLTEEVMLAAMRAASDVTETAGASVLQVPEAPDSSMLNRVVGLGVSAAASEDDIDAALAAIRPGVTFYVAVAPHAQPKQLSDWLRARGLQPGWGWMTFQRDLRDPPPVETSLRLIEVETDSQAMAFSRVVRLSYELPEAVEPRLAGLHDAGWRCWIALDGDVPAGVGALYVAEEVAYLGFAGSLPEHRGKGAQTSLLGARLNQAAELVCRLAVTETGEMGGDRPSNSYRNILRAGFTETEVTANWRGVAPGKT